MSCATPDVVAIAEEFGAPAPRDYQIDLVAEAYDVLMSGRNPLIVAPTGAGKTWVGVYIFLCLHTHSWSRFWLAHRRELIKQPFARMMRAGLPSTDVGVILPGVPTPKLGAEPGRPLAWEDDDAIFESHARRRRNAPIQVASIQTAARRVLRTADQHVTLIDEAQRAPSKQYQKLLAKHPEARTIGLTAAAWRTDGQGFDQTFDVMLLAPTFAELVARGSLVAPSKIWGRPAEKLADTRGITKRAGDYAAGELGRAQSKPALIADIVTHWKLRGNDAPTLAFCVNVEHAELVAQEFTEAGIPALSVTANTTRRDREWAWQRLRAGTLKVITNCEVATEGIDLPFVKTLIIARPTLSLSLHLQMIGRGARPTEANDHPFVLLDHAGNCSNPLLGLPTDDREWSLEAREKRGSGKTSELAAVSQCKACFVVFTEPGVTTCPECGFFNQPAVREIKHDRSVDLIEIKAATAWDEHALWDAIVAEFRERNATQAKVTRPGWCFHQYQRRHGKMPPKGVPLPLLSDNDVERLERIKQLRKQAKALGYKEAWIWIKLNSETNRSQISGAT